MPVALAMMANNPKVRERIAKQGINIPSDTHFLAARMDTTTDVIRLFDLEDAPLPIARTSARLQEEPQRSLRAHQPRTLYALSRQPTNCHRGGSRGACPQAERGLESSQTRMGFVKQCPRS